MFYNIFPQKFNFYFKILRTFKIFNNEMYMYTISVKNFKSPCLSCINYFLWKNYLCRRSKSKATFGIKPSEHKAIKGLKRESLRDHMTPVELALVNLSEVTAREIHKTKNTKGREALKDDVLKAGKIAGKARKNIELETGRPVVSSKNYLGLSSNKKEIKE